MSRAAAPFDALAPGYDATFTARPIARHLRRAVWRELAPHVRAGTRALDLGCGTGEDALWLVERGARVLGVDRSAGMLARAAAKLEGAGRSESARWARLDLAELDPGGRELLAPVDGEPFDLAFADMGALNCLAARRPLGAALWHALAPGGRFVAVPMGRVCAWEIAWHLLHGDVARARRRLAGEAHAAPSPGEAAIPVFYPTAGELARELAPWFRRVRRVAIGAFVPPPYLDPVAARWPRALAACASLDRRLGALPPLPSLADHHLLHFERRDVPRFRDAAEAALDAAASAPGRARRRAAARRLLALRFRLTGGDRLRRGARVRVAGRALAVAPGVFDPVLFRTAPALVDAIANAAAAPGARWLDLGTGSGLGALLALAADAGARAVATDVDPRAVACAEANAALWGVAGRFEARLGDLFAPVGGARFDVVLFHPPYWRGDAPRDPRLGALERAFYAPDDLARRFASELERHLAPAGFGLLLLSSSGVESGFLAACREAGLAVAVLLRRDVGSEVLSAYRVRPRRPHGAAA